MEQIFYGIWNKHHKFWHWLREDRIEIFHTEHLSIARATLETLKHSNYDAWALEVRAIGPDGLPVAEDDDAS